MKVKVHNWPLTMLVLMAVSPATLTWAEDALPREPQLKAVFVHKFIKFVEWPPDKTKRRSDPFIIGVVGPQDYVTAFERINNRKVKNRHVSVKHFAGYEQFKGRPEASGERWQKEIAALKNCDVLLLCCPDAMPKAYLSETIQALRDSSILIVGETEGFLEHGGMINLLMEDQKVRFEINNASAKQARLIISSQLLRLAKRVITKNAGNRAER